MILAMAFLAVKCERHIAVSDGALVLINCVRPACCRFQVHLMRFGNEGKYCSKPGDRPCNRQALQHGGLVHLRTDHSGYFLHVLSLLKQVDRLRPRVCRNDDLRRRIPGSNVRSEFEQMFSCQQKPIFYLVLENSRPTR